ncbi:MAG TPA: sorbosone dehydrogenase family protein [Pelomicrobium sp.]|nr:sorbosone dehydrogenase family protein [Pelomicrobium sp.]
MRNVLRAAFCGVCLLALTACGDTAELPASAGVGPDPRLPAPDPPLVPTVHIAPATGWPEGKAPTPAEGLAVRAFARGLEHPRWLHVLPNGDVLVAESAAPAQAGDGGIVAWIEHKVMQRAGAAVPSADRITLLRDADGDGAPELRTVLLEGLHSPFGMALLGDYLYVANTDAVVRFPYTPGATRLDATAEKVVDLPAQPPNRHWTRDLIASRDGERLYATVGSNSNIGENGMDKEAGRAAVWEIDPRTGESRLYASGLRNPNGLAWEPRGGALWVAVNERDELGSDLVPDYMTALVDGGFYGWPWSYFGQHVDGRVEPQRPELVARALVPDYALGPHTASLGMAFTDSDNALPPRFAYGVFVGQHGSWNRRPFAGYQVIFVPFADSKPAGAPLDVLTGFLSAEGKAYGRPVGVALDRTGALLVADDVGNVVWRVHTAP